MLLPLLMFAAGITLIGTAVMTGEADVSLVVIFPVFSGSSALFLLGTVLLILSFLAGFAILAMDNVEVERREAQPPGRARSTETGPKTRFGGMVLIGPIPIAFGSDKNIAVLMLALGVATIVGVLVLLLFLAQ